MTETELSWLAGWLEGEGSFIVTSTAQKGRRYPRVRVNGVSTDRDVLEYVQSLTGGVINGPYERSGGGGKDYFVWSVASTPKALALMKHVEPYMIGTRRRAAVKRAIEAAEEYAATPRGEKGKHYGRTAA